ncbi:MAG TPA: calcium-translocating P-type ATPase, SERCA-type [Clostridiales bacterium]|nr:calcium-translocating P-type ATPase, SERCA-type [Clostridiales bacterium]
MNHPFSKETESVIKELQTDIKAGLTKTEADKRLAKYGPNSLGEEKKVPLWKRFLGQFADAMVLILIGAAVLSAIMAIKEGGFSGWIDVIVILAIVIINAILGVYQEGKADEAIAALKKMSSPQAKVIRDNMQQMIDSDKLVPGDIVVLDAGDLVAADIRLTEASSMKVEEASLTGESVPVDKDATVVLEEDCGIGDRKNMLYMGTAVTYGRGRGIVVETGANTELGKIASRLSSIDNEETPLQKNLTKLGKILGIVCVAICLIVFAVDVFAQGEPWEEALMTAVSLAVAAIPEGLAAVVTIVLALGMTKMASKNAIVRRLLAVETLGCVDVICTDKTGTLTQNEMTVRKVFDGEKSFDVTGIGYAPEGQIQDENETKITPDAKLVRLLQACVLCSDAVTPKGEDGRYSCIGDPTEAALVALGAKSGLPKEETNKLYPRIAELPFDSDRKMMTTYHPNIIPGSIVSFTKGAPDIVLDRCTEYFDGQKNVPMTDEIRKRIAETNHGYATKALRVLAFAYRSFEGKTEIDADFAHEADMCFIGLVGMIDPARTEVKDAMAICREAGIRAVMITGDYKDTAVAIANDLGMMDENSGSLSGAELDKVSDEDFQTVCETTNVYARVSPDHKVRIVTALKKNDHIASMTGDGVNDAMALKSADIGVAMGITGTDVAKNSSDMILTDDNFATIVSAVEEGRVIYSNIRKFVGFLLSCNVGEILIIFLISLIPTSLITGIGTPLTAIQLLWLNLVTDSFPALALGREKGEPDIMKQPPRRKSESIINKSMKINILVQSLAIFAAVFTSFVLGLTVFFKDEPVPIEGARTMAFATLILAELFRAYGARSERISVFKLGVFSNKFMNISVAGSIALLMAVIYIPGVNGIFDNIALNPVLWIPIVLLALIPFTASEIHKMIKNRK